MSVPYTANADYIVIDRSPLVLEAGQVVRVGAADRVWTGWVHVTTGDERGTYVPVASLDRQDGSTAVVRDRFDATDLSVRRGDRVDSLREIEGWHWCRSAQGREGWVPGYLLEALSC